MSSRFGRYLVWQSPGWIAVSLALLALRWVADLPDWIVPVGVVVVIAKDLAMYRVVRHTLEPPRARLLGVRGRTVERLAPMGYVRVHGELWRAETAGEEIAAGADIVVLEVNGLTLRVGPADPS
jgi:membrane-bound ClpP family serine protease